MIAFSVCFGLWKPVPESEEFLVKRSLIASLVSYTVEPFRSSGFGGVPDSEEISNFYCIVHSFKSFLLALLVGLAFSQTPPTLSDDFTAVVISDFRIRGHRRHFDGTWFFDFTGARERFEGMHNAVEVGDLFRNWNSTHTGGSEWFYRASDKKCDKRPFDQKLFGLWDWLPHSKANGKCDHAGTQGNRFSLQNAEVHLDACISTDGMTPHFVDVRLHRDDLHVFTIFRKWQAGRPASQNFNLPAGCPSATKVFHE